MHVLLPIVLFLPLVTGAADVNDHATDHAFQEQTYVYTGGPYKAEPFKYQLLTPEKVEPGQKYPVVLFLHGAGERGNDNKAQLKYFPDVMATPANRKKYPCYVIAPQCRANEKWSDVDWSKKTSQGLPEKPSDQMEVAVGILQEALKKYPIDPDRVYLTGLSMGGYGTWDLAERHPDWFAAIAPVCGGGDESEAGKLVHLPIWVWHGDNDGAVPVDRSRTMVAAVKQAGGNPKYTELPGVGHNSWTTAYAENSGLLDWMFEQKRKATPSK